MTLRRLETWAGRPLKPTTFNHCLRTHFQYHSDAGNNARRLPAVAAYIKAGAVHGPLLATLGISSFSYLGRGNTGFVIEAKACDKQPLAIKIGKGRTKRPRHARIVPTYLRLKRARKSDYNLEIMPLVDTSNITDADVLDVAADLALSGLWVEDLNEDNIGRYKGEAAVFDVSAGVFDARKQPRKFASSIRMFTNRRWKNKRDARLLVLQQIADGKLKPRKHRRKTAHLALPLPGQAPA